MSVKIDTDTLAFLIGDCARLMRLAFEKRIVSAGLGLTAGEARTLFQIAAFPNSRQLDIAVRMGIEPMTVSAFLDRLQTQGLVERQPDPQDRRAKRISLTEAAEEMIGAISAEILSLQAEATKDLDQATQDAVRQALAGMRQNLQTVAPAPADLIPAS